MVVARTRAWPPFGGWRQTERRGLRLSTLRHGIEGVDLDDPVRLIEGQAIGLGRGGREDIDHRAQHRIFAGLIHALVRRVARIAQEGLERRAIQRLVGLHTQAGVDPFTRRGALRHRVRRGDQKGPTVARFGQGRQDRHSPAHALTRGRCAVIGQAIPRRQDQNFGVTDHDGERGRDLVSTTFARCDKDDRLQRRRLPLRQCGCNGRRRHLPILPIVGARHWPLDQNLLARGGHVGDVG